MTVLLRPALAAARASVGPFRPPPTIRISEDVFMLRNMEALAGLSMRFCAATVAPNDRAGETTHERMAGHDSRRSGTRHCQGRGRSGRSDPDLPRCHRRA